MAGTSQTYCAALCLNLAFVNPANNAGTKLKANMCEKRNSKLLDDVGRCISGNTTFLVQPANRGPYPAIAYTATKCNTNRASCQPIMAALLESLVRKRSPEN